MFRFEYINHLYFLLAGIFAIMLFVNFILWRKKSFNKLGKTNLLLRLSPQRANRKLIWKFSIVIIALIFIVLGFANPQLGTKYEKVERKGIDVIVAFDVSKSMLARDIKPSRLLKAKQFVSNLINNMANDRIGIIVFAGNAYIQMPLTVDYSAGKMYLKTLNTKMVPTQGTAIGEAVNLAIRSFNNTEKKHKALIVVTDGENHEDDALETIKKATDAGIIVYTIGVGTSKGAPISIGANNTYKKDRDGNIVLSKLNENMLINMAREGKGKYFNIQEQNIHESIIKDISQLEGKVFDEKIFTEYASKFQLFLFVGFILLMMDLSLTERKFNWIHVIQNLIKK